MFPIFARRLPKCSFPFEEKAVLPVSTFNVHRGHHSPCPSSCETGAVLESVLNPCLSLVSWMQGQLHTLGSNVFVFVPSKANAGHKRGPLAHSICRRRWETTAEEESVVVIATPKELMEAESECS